MASQTEENYLKSLFTLTGRDKETSLSELGKLLGVRLPTVNSMMRNLKNQGLVNYQKYKPVSLTPKGKKEASLILRKHRLTEMFLVNKMGFGWEEVHDIAEQIEHINSVAFFNRMDEMLGFPQFDPHGSPIPDKHGNINREISLRLSDCEAGEKVMLAAISTDSTNFIQFLDNNGLTLGIEIYIDSIEPFDKSMKVSYKDRTEKVFSQLVCERLLVERMES